MPPTIARRPTASGPRRRLALVLAFASLVAAALAAGCGGSDGDAATTTTSGSASQLGEDGVLTYGSSMSIAPFAFLDPGSGEPRGLDVDIARELADRLGLEARFVDNPSFDALIPALQDGQYDAIIAAITIKPERAEVIDFTEPYIDSDQALVVPSDSPIERLQDLGEDDVVGVQKNTTSADYADAEVAPRVREVRTYDAVPQELQDLAVGRLQAVVADAPFAGYAVKREFADELRIAETFRTGEQYGIGVAKDDKQLTAALNRELKAMRADGTYDELLRKWLGDLPQ